MKRTLWVTLWILAFAIISPAQTTFYFPHIANGILGSPPETWKTTIFLTNLSSTVSTSGTITLTQSDTSSAGLAGTAFSSISFVDETGAVSTGSPIAFSIPPLQTKKYTSTGAGGYLGGFASVVATTGTLAGTSVFSRLDAAGNLIAEAGVPAAPAVPKQLIFVDTTGGFSVGVAYANPSASSATITLSLLNSTAVPVATTPQTLGPGNHVAAFTSDLFGISTPLVGTMQVVSSVPLAAIALRFAPAPSEVYTTLSPVTLASIIAPAVEWLQGHPWLSPISSVARLLAGMQFRI